MSCLEQDVCPECSRVLHRIARPFGLLWVCTDCEAAYLTLPVLRRLLPDTIQIKHLHPSSHGSPPDGATCPFCGHPQVLAAVSFDYDEFRLPYCRICCAFRLNRAALKAIPIPVVSQETKAVRQIEARQKVALASLIRSLETV